jgi:hypothetical protein
MAGRGYLGERVAPLLGPPAPSSYQGLVTALINELAGWPVVIRRCSSWTTIT